jgi:hypothetical protein
LLGFFVFDGDGFFSSSDDDDDVSLSLVALGDFDLGDFAAETAAFDGSVTRFFTVFFPVADVLRVFLTVP